VVLERGLRSAEKGRRAESRKKKKRMGRFQEI